MVAGNDRLAIEFTISTGNQHDAPEGRLLLETIGKNRETIYLIMDRAYQDDYTQYTASMLKFHPVVPPKCNRLNPWEYDKELYKRRNEVERLFRRLKGFRRVFTRYDKSDVMFIAFIHFALLVINLK
jgi:transposase